MYTKADWEELKADLRDTDWSYIDKCSASESAARTTNLILSCAERHIPRKQICTKKKSHPWLTEKIVQLVADKHAATGTTEYEAAVKACSAGMLSEYNLYTLDARKKLLEAKSGSKRWWTLSRELLMQRTKVQNMPALKADNGSWMHESAHKAELLANTFNGKNVLPELSENEYTELPRSEHSQNLRNVWSESSAGKVLASLDESSGTGPDLLPSKILKYCAKELAFPVLQLALRILATGEWPHIWREHWMVPIYKRNAVFQPQNYRAIHMTAVLPKVVERLVLLLLTPHVTLWSLAGENQFQQKSHDIHIQKPTPKMNLPFFCLGCRRVRRLT